MLQRRGTTAQWEDVKDTLILASGEIGIIVDTTANNGKFKIGDGVTLWKNLNFYQHDGQNTSEYVKLIASQTITGTQTLTPANAISVPLVISGTGSQSGDLQRWKTSADVVKASVNYDGKLTANGGTFNASVSLNNNKITDLATPTEDQDATNKAYVDAAINGLVWKAPVNLVSYSSGSFVNVPLTGTGGTVVLDGHSALTATQNGYRLLLTAQTTSSENGIYVYTQTAGTYVLTRSDDADTYQKLINASVYVNEGTVYGTSSWVQSNHYLTSFSGQSWTKFNGASTTTAGAGLAANGNIFNVGAGTGITVNADDVQISATYPGQSSITTLGTVSAGTWSADTIATDKGGTGITSYSVGDLLYGSGTSGATQLSKLSAGTNNHVLKSGGAGVAPSWGQIVTASLENASDTITGVTYAKMQYISGQNKLLGRISSGSGVVEELSADNLITLLNTASTNTISANRLTSSSGGNFGTSTDAARKDHTHTIDDLSDVIITGSPVVRQVIKFNGTNWINELPSGGISVGSTSPTSPSSGDAWMDSNDGSLYVYYNDTTSRPAGTNIITNPSFETNATGWTGTSSTIARSTSFEYLGLNSLKVTPSANTGKVSFTATTVNSTVYRFSAYVYTEVTKNLRVAITSPTTNGTTTTVPYNTWTRLDVSFTANSTSTTVNIESIDSTDVFYVDAVMLEASANLNDYFDGSSYLGTWTGSAHASTSTTTGGTAAQWIQVRANSALEGTILTRLGAVESRATSLEAANPVVVNGTAGRTAAYPSPVQGNTVFRTDLGYMERYYTAYDATTNPSGTTGTVGWYEYRGGAPLSQNYIINGAFDIWQRGTSATTAGYGSADRFMHTVSAGPATISRSTDVPSNEFVYSLSFASTSGTNPFICQRIESANSVNIAGKTVTLSIWAKSTVGTGPLIWDAAYPTATDNWTSETYDTGGTFAATMTVGTWTRYSATFTANALATRGYRINMYRNVTTTSTTTLYTGVQLEVGSVATSFRRNAPSIQGELAACQRYYVRCTGDQVLSPGFARTSTVFTSAFSLPVEMRTTPTIETNTSSGVNFATVETGDQDFGNMTVSKTSGSNSGTRAVGINATNSGATMIVGRGGVLRLQGSTAFVGFIAEL
jgi:hypothetical protein